MKRIIIFSLLILVLASAAFADEGMWLLTQLNQLKLEEKGLLIDVKSIYDPGKTSLTDAIVWLGGCSASFVSPEGLVLTNHHCAYGALQRASAATPGTDYIKNGFLAAKRSEELEARGMSASVLIDLKDVTVDVLKQVKGITDPVAREKKINEKIVQITDKAEGGKEDRLAQVASMFNGKQYILFVYQRYQDVRIVYAPPLSIGKYGGEIDNWMWPRHTGDFTYLRVYSAPDGSGAKYNAANIPVKPKNYLRIASEPLKDGDFTFVLGFPGSTTRYRTSNSVGWNLKYNYPETVKEFQEIIDLMDEVTQDDPNGKIKVAGLRAGLANTLKNYQGNIDGMTKTHFVDQKIAFEKELMTFLKSDAKLNLKYGSVLEGIKGLYMELAKTKTKDDLLQRSSLFGGTLYSIASQIVGVAEERAKPAKEREPGFSERDVQRAAEQLPMRYLGYYEPFDKAMMKRFLKKAGALPEGLKIKGLDYIFNSGVPVDEFVEKAYAATKLADAEYTKGLYSKSLKELEALKDPMITLAVALYGELDAYGKRNEIFSAKVTELRKEYLNALYAWKGEGLYPDANSTMRFTYGNVAGYVPADAVQYKPFTTLKGVIEKNTGVEPFDMPEKLAALHKARDFGRWADPRLNDVPVAFTCRCDITGGNSGSAVMNARGELIGLAFDGNYEAMTSDWQYDYQIQRCIAVDIRYVMFITEKFGEATWLLKEMGL